MNAIQPSNIILIVDDSPHNLEILSDTLTDAGFEFAIATTGEAALEQLNYVAVSLILLDVMMPGIGGFETCRRLQANPATANIPIIFMTALTDVDSKVKGLSLGAVDYITKPFAQGEVIARINLHLKLSQLTRSLEQKVSDRTQALEKAQKQLEVYVQTLEDKVEARTLELQAVQQQLISQEKLASLGALTAGVAHELRNPLNFVNNYAEGSAELGGELLEILAREADSFTPESLRECQEIATDIKNNAIAIQTHGQRAASTIRNMMQHARSDDRYCQKTHLNRLVDEARQLAYHSRRSLDNSFNVTFVTVYDESIGELELFSASLSRAFINLIDNACYAAWSHYLQQGEPFAPKLWIKTKNHSKAVEISIRDNGAGIPDEIVEKVFEPFFTTKPTGEGIGLGLSLTHEIIVGQHGGNLIVETDSGAYTEFIISLPKKAGVLQ
ncbi:MAG: response regulator [Spirulinaceae cyanobacterium]